MGVCKVLLFHNLCRPSACQCLRNLLNSQNTLNAQLSWFFAELSKHPKIINWCQWTRRSKRPPRNNEKAKGKGQKKTTTSGTRASGPDHFDPLFFFVLILFYLLDPVPFWSIYINYHQCPKCIGLPAKGLPLPVEPAPELRLNENITNCWAQKHGQLYSYMFRTCRLPMPCCIQTIKLISWSRHVLTICCPGFSSQSGS